MKQVRQFLESKGSEKPEAKQLKRFWTKGASHVGLLVSERVINIPMELVPPLYEGLFQEILWATEDEVCAQMLVFCLLVFLSDAVRRGRFSRFFFYFLIISKLRAVNLFVWKSQPTEELRNFFQFKHYLVVTKVFEELPKTSKSSENGQVKHKIL